MQKFEIGISLFLITMSLIAVWQSLYLPAGTFDALGSAGFPIVIACVTGILSAFILARACFRRLRVETKASDQSILLGNSEETSLTHRDRVDLAFTFFALTFLYVLALALELTSFGILTTLFLCLAFSLLNKITPKSLALYILISVILGFGCETLFIQVFSIDLP